jgi:hypothetical protein
LDVEITKNINFEILDPGWHFCFIFACLTWNDPTVCIYFGSWSSKWLPKMASHLFYGEVCWTKLSFPHSESKFVWEVPLGLEISKLWARHYLLNTNFLDKIAISWICWTKITKIVILSYFPYKNLGEVKIRSLVQEISS